MTWWTEPDPDRRARAKDAETARLEQPGADDAVTVSFDDPSTTVRLDAVQNAPTAAFEAAAQHGGPSPTAATTRLPSTPTAPTVPISDDPTRTRVMPTALIPHDGPRANDAPTVAVQRLSPRATPPPAAHIPIARPLEAGAGPWSPQEARAARSHRTRPGLGVLGWLRLLLGQALLAVGVLLVAAGFGTAVDADLATTWNQATGAGLVALVLAWIVLPGPIGGTIAAILLTGVAWVATLVGLWVLHTDPLQQTIGAQATGVIVNWVAPALVLTLAATAWISVRGKHPASIVVLLLPIVVAVAAGLVIADGWLFGEWPSELLAPVVDAVSPVVAGWFEPWPEIAARIPAGVDGWLRVAAAVAPAMLLAWPLRSRNRALR